VSPTEPTIGRPVVVDRLTRVAPLGLRFFDRASGRYVSDLLVSARQNRPAGVPSTHDRPLPLHANASGVFVLHGGVPSVRAFEVGRASAQPDADFWADWPAPTAYTLSVADPAGRFLPFSLVVSVPSRGLYQWLGELDSPAELPVGQPLGDVALFSAPSRPAPEGMAVVRAELYDPLADRPAAWALLEVRHRGRLLGRGLADERGQVAAFVPYPTPVGFQPGSPPGVLSPPDVGAPGEPTWTVTIRVGYPLGRPTSPGEPPDLAAVIAQLQRPPANLWADVALTRPFGEATLGFGQDLVLRRPTTSPPESSGAAPVAPSRLLVTPAASPP
jgi:hypothetical protein